WRRPRGQPIRQPPIAPRRVTSARRIAGRRNSTNRQRHRHNGKSRDRQGEPTGSRDPLCTRASHGGEPISNPNPLGESLALLIGAGAFALTAWQQAVVAAVFELYRDVAVSLNNLAGLYHVQGRYAEPLPTCPYKKAS